MDKNKKLRILAVGAHPDDIEISCAGTLAKYSKLGHTVIMCHAANGDLGHFYIPRKILAKTREKEAKKSGGFINAKVVNLNLHDLGVYPDKKTLYLFVDLIRETKPDLIITHYPEDYMQDHCYTSKLVLDASFAVAVPQLKTKKEFYPKIVPVYYMDTAMGMNFLPTEYVDITDFIEIKKKMLACHKSQIVWLKEHDNIDVIDTMVAISKFRGLQANVKYAEGFRKAEVYPRSVTTRLLP